MKNCSNCNKRDVCGGNFTGFFTCPDFTKKKTKKKTPHHLDRCDVCGKKVRGNAEMCSACRKPFMEIQSKFPTHTHGELLISTRKLIKERKNRTIEKRNKQRLE